MKLPLKQIPPAPAFDGITQMEKPNVQRSADASPGLPYTAFYMLAVLNLPNVAVV